MMRDRELGRYSRNSIYVCLGTGCTRFLTCLKDKQCYADGNTHIGYVEDPGAEVPNAKIHEIDDAPFMEQAIQEVAHSTAQHKTPREPQQL